MKRLLPFVTAFFLACGARPPAPVDVDDEPLPPAGDRPALQLYLVLTNDATAMQDEASVAAMWDAVHGRTARYQPIFKHVTWAPPGYELTVDLDFADLPHPALDPKAIEAIVATLPEAAQAKARAAKFGVIFQSDAAVLPGGAHIRLAGTAALYAADRYDGVVLDLLARRGWTPDAWLAELAAPE
ncbi:MAG: hypothetical protein KC620_22590, partial [Myxococcales bacterium]|nr:hypothetical protein [Myxococcales bacterium]